MHMAKDGKGALSFQPLLGVIRSILWGSHGGEMADPMIEAQKSLGNWALIMASATPFCFCTT